ncbi:hypothetical protein HYU22_00845 [Candidatus Woesearchaeota archaeon]|nr:hypothetical protein [Candidatus Woesearchaeota archaeon]
MRLLPSLRQNKRYVVFEVQSPETFSVQDLQQEVQRALHSFWGELGVSRASPVFIKERFNPATKRFIIKVNHKYVEELKAALTLSKTIKKAPILLRSIITSGTLKKASSFVQK